MRCHRIFAALWFLRLASDFTQHHDSSLPSGVKRHQHHSSVQAGKASCMLTIRVRATETGELEMSGQTEHELLLQALAELSNREGLRPQLEKLLSLIHI